MRRQLRPVVPKSCRSLAEMVSSKYLADVPANIKTLRQSL